jgi:hypothetical protein
VLVTGVELKVLIAAHLWDVISDGLEKGKESIRCDHTLPKFVDT